MKSFLCRTSLVVAGLSATPLAAQTAAELQAELVAIDTQIADAEAQIARSDSGLIRDLAEGRREALLLSRTLLENRIHVTEGAGTIEVIVSAVDPDETRAAQIAEEMTAAEARLVQAEEEASKITGGLLQGLALSRVETEKLTLAQLRMGYLQAKYGIAFPLQIAPSAPTEDVPPVSTSIATDPAPIRSGLDWADPRFAEIDYNEPIFLTAHRNGERISGWWGIKSERAAIDDSPKVTTINYSAHDPSNFMGDTGLIARCTEGETALMFVQPDFIMADFTTGRFDMALRIDDEQPIEARWEGLTNNQGAGLFGRPAEEFIRQIYDAKQLFVRLTDTTGQRHDAVFELAGGQDAYEEVAAACGWSTISLSTDDYRAIQTLLNTAGLDAGTPDGQWGPGSQSAMKAYQASVGLPETGAPDRSTLDKLGLGLD